MRTAPPTIAHTWFEDTAVHDTLLPGPEEVVPRNLSADTLEPAAAEQPTTPFAEPEERYQILDLLGVGGMGEVWRVEDRRFNRSLAMKTLRRQLASNIQAIARFREEALSTARLQHPGIVPVHDLGRLPDGRYFFTMKEIRGKTFAEVIAEVHAAADTTPSGWNFNRLMDAFRRACEAVAHAHTHGVLHRDLKPANLMIGDHGEVLVLDWGIARHLDPDATGILAGTPAYMAPELVELTPLSLRQDVYSLGAVLYEILTGEPPYHGSPEEILVALRAGPPPEPAGMVGVPRELLSLCHQAMQRNPELRPADAGALVAALLAWQEGARRRDSARELVQQAEDQLPQLEVLREKAAEADRAARREREKIRPFEAVERKAEAWRLEDEAAAMVLAAEEAERAVFRLLHAALAQAPDLKEAHRSLAMLYHSRHQEAERERDAVAARRYESLLRDHDDGRFSDYLKGDGWFSLHTERPATAQLFQYVEVGRRLVAQPLVEALPTPIENYQLPMGSYLLILEAPGHLPTRYPLLIPRAGHETGIAPGEHHNRPVHLLKSCGPNQIFVPAGWTTLGGDPRAVTGAPRQKVWLEDFLIDKFPVTNADYLRFLNHLVTAGRSEEAFHFAPRERAREGEGALVYGWNSAGFFELVSDADGDAWSPDWPVCLVDAEGAAAYAAWRAEQEGLPWRLPSEQEWEKAARGVDGRFYPWGDRFDATWACLRDSHAGRPLPASIYAFPQDESVYGMQGAAGNMCDWCTGVEGVLIRGGAWSHAAQLARLCERRIVAASLRSETISFRTARSL